MAGVTRFLVIAAALGAAGLGAAVALAVPGNPTRAIRAADQAHAKTILLKKTELPGTGWSGEPTDWGQVNPDCVVKSYSLSKLTANAEIGVQFTRPVDKGTFLVESDVHVFATSAQAAAAVKKRATLGYARCLGKTLASEAPFGSKATSGAKALAVNGLALPTHGFRITVKIVMSHQTSTLSAFVLGFLHARTLTTLSVLAIDKHWSTAMLRSVASKLALRTSKR